MLGVVRSNLTIFKLEPTTPNMSQHIATRWPNASNMLRPTMLQNVTLAWPGLEKNCNAFLMSKKRGESKEMVDILYYTVRTKVAALWAVYKIIVTF